MDYYDMCLFENISELLLCCILKHFPAIVIWHGYQLKTTGFDLKVARSSDLLNYFSNFSSLMLPNEEN